jgi:hypothetical protein
VNSRLSDDFIAHFSKLPDAAKAQARKSYQLWRANPQHPGLQFKRIHGRENMYSVRVGLGWRALGLLEGETIYWFWIGPHAEYDIILNRT